MTNFNSPHNIYVLPFYYHYCYFSNGYLMATVFSAVLNLKKKKKIWNDTLSFFGKELNNFQTQQLLLPLVIYSIFQCSFIPLIRFFYFFIPTVSYAKQTFINRILHKSTIFAATLYILNTSDFQIQRSLTAGRGVGVRSRPPSHITIVHCRWLH